MKNSIQGIILISLLIFMLILTSLGLYVIEMTLLETKMTHDLWQQHKLFNLSEQALNAAETAVIHSVPICLIPVTDAHQLINRPISWWDRSGCKGGDQIFSYYYVVEWLGIDPCALIEQSNYSKKITASYFRVTLLSLPKVGDAKIILQSSIAKSNIENDSAICDGTTYAIKTGRQMWRDMTEGF